MDLRKGGCAHSAIEWRLCGALSATPAPTALTVSDTASKADLVGALKASFDFCGPVLDGLKHTALLLHWMKPFLSDHARHA